jgi:hypothetical protein
VGFSVDLYVLESPNMFLHVLKILIIGGGETSEGASAAKGAGELTIAHIELCTNVVAIVMEGKGLAPEGYH